MPKTVSVWLILEDGANKGKIILQKRSNVPGHTFPFVCQATWAGKREELESAMDAVVRECKEELGELFCSKIDFEKLEDMGHSQFIDKGKEWVAHNYFGKINQSVLDLAEVHHEALPDLLFVDKDSLVYPLGSKKDPKENIVLFDDQYKILKQILEK